MRATILLGLLFVCSLSVNAQPVSGETESFAERAEIAHVAGDYELAVDLYSRWLEADPDDFRSWYNYSCALALNSDTTDALAALQSAVDYGWRDSTWTVRDPDLASLHGSPAFAHLIGRMGQILRDDSIQLDPSFPRYALQERLAPYTLYLPHGYDTSPQKSYPLLVLLHGRGSNMDGMDNLRERLALPGVIIAQPQAPYAINESLGGYEYWPSHLQTEFGDTLLRTIRDDAGMWVASVIAAVSEDTRVDASNVFVAGFSQGGAAACVAAILNSESIRGLAIIGGYIPETHKDSLNYQHLASQDVAVFIAHGRRDRVVELSRAEELHASLADAGVDVEYASYQAEHEITDEMVVNLADWFTRLVDRPKRLFESGGTKVDSSRVTTTDGSD